MSKPLNRLWNGVVNLTVQAKSRLRQTRLDSPSLRITILARASPPAPRNFLLWNFTRELESTRIQQMCTKLRASDLIKPVVNTRRRRLRRVFQSCNSTRIAGSTGNQRTCGHFQDYNSMRSPASTKVPRTLRIPKLLSLMRQAAFI